MSKKQESLRAELRNILSRGGRSVISKSSDGKAVPVPEEAEVFEIDFVKDGESYGKVYVSIDGLHQLIVYFDDKVANSPKNGSADSESWEQLVRTLKRFAMMKQLSFKLEDLDNLENDMAKREHTKKQETMYEGYHAQGKKASYSDTVPTTKMIIKHKRNMEEGEQRFRQIDKIFIENSIGERALAPTDKPGLARVFARHIAEGGKANDDRWNHISGLCEEYGKMAGFVRATRNNQFNESAQKLVTEGINHYQKLRECLGKMSGKRGYNNYFESYTPSLMEDEDSVDLSEMFMSSSLDPRIESVMPILSKLSKHISETSEMAETIALEEWADDIIGDSPKAATKSNKPSDKEVAKRMHAILSKGKEEVEEMDSQGYTGSRDGGDPDAGKKEHYGKMAKPGDVVKQGVSSLNKAMSSARPSDKEVAKKMHSILSKGKKDVAEEQVNELSKGTLKSYSKSAGQDVHADQRDAGGARDQAAHSKKHGDVKQSAAWKDEAEWLDKRAEKRAGGVARATTKIAQKGVAEDTEEELSDLSKIKTAKLQQLHALHSHYGQTDPRSKSAAQRGAAELKRRGIIVPGDKEGVAEDLDSGQKRAGQFSPKDAYAKPGSLVGTNESSDPLDRIKQIMNHRR